MAVVNTKANAVTNADAAPSQSFSSTKIAGGRIKEAVGFVAALNGDSIASTYRFARVHSSWRPSRVLLSSEAITSGAADIGIFDIAANGGLAVDADLFGSAVSIASAQSNVDVTHESGVITLVKVEQQLWQLLGLTSDPGKWYDLTATLTAATTAAGTVALKFQYLDGN
jgi:hypothetical protein